MNGNPVRVTIQGKSIEGRNGVNGSLLVAGGTNRPSTGKMPRTIIIWVFVMRVWSRYTPKYAGYEPLVPGGSKLLEESKEKA